MTQPTFASLAWDGKGKVTRARAVSGRDGRGDSVGAAHGADCAALSEGRPGTQPMPLERMLRIYFLQHWFNLSDPAMEDALYDSEAMRRFAGIELSVDGVPDESTILRFRHLLERHQLTEAMFAAVRTLLEDKRLLLKAGTIVDATIIEAPPSTKCGPGARPGDAPSEEGRRWRFGEAHVGRTPGGSSTA